MNKLGIVFPGQGSQYVGMCKTLFENFKTVKDVFEEANECLGFDLQKMCFEGDIIELTKTENAQLAILTSSVASFKVCNEEFGIVPHYTAGHSLGEISALTCSGAIEFKDALKIVSQRGMFMKQADVKGLGTMSAIIGVDPRIVAEECKRLSDQGIVVVANYNSSKQTVISGDIDSVKKAEEVFGNLDAMIVRLKVSGAFHSPMMQSASEKLEKELKMYKYNNLKWPVISNLTALPYKNEMGIVQTLTKQIVSPVRWLESMNYMREQGVDTIIEVGPKSVLKNLMKNDFASIKTLSFDLEEDYKIVKDMAKDDATENECYDENMEFIRKCVAIAICTKNNNSDNEEYYKGFVEPYRKIKELYQTLQEEKKKPRIEQLDESLNMLINTFVTKQTPKDEQSERFNELFVGVNFKNSLSNYKYIIERL